MDHQLTRMVNGKEDHYETAGAVDELELERQRKSDPLRPLVLLLLDIARRQLREEEERHKQVPVLPNRKTYERP